MTTYTIQAQETDYLGLGPNDLPMVRVYLRTEGHSVEATASDFTVEEAEDKALARAKERLQEQALSIKVVVSSPPWDREADPAHLKEFVARNSRAMGGKVATVATPAPESEIPVDHSGPVVTECDICHRSSDRSPCDVCNTPISETDPNLPTPPTPISTHPQAVTVLPPLPAEQPHTSPHRPTEPPARNGVHAALIHDCEQLIGDHDIDDGALTAMLCSSAPLSAQSEESLEALRTALRGYNETYPLGEAQSPINAFEHAVAESELRTLWRAYKDLAPSLTPLQRLSVYRAKEAAKKRLLADMLGPTLAPSEPPPNDGTTFPQAVECTSPRCDAMIFFLPTNKGGTAPVDAFSLPVMFEGSGEPKKMYVEERGIVHLRDCWPMDGDSTRPPDGYAHHPHFATCKDPDKFRKGYTKGKGKQSEARA